jgi:hypothetical protein
VSASITPSGDGRYVDVFVPIAFKRFGGRKVIVAPDGKPVPPDRSKAADTTLTKALARACRWQKLLDDAARCSCQSMENGASRSASRSVSGLVPFRMASTMSGARSDSRIVRDR